MRRFLDGLYLAAGVAGALAIFLIFRHGSSTS